MNKSIVFTFLALGGILTLSSCKKDDMEVFVGEDIRDKDLLEAIKALPDPKTEVAESDIKYPEYESIMPEGYSVKAKSESGRQGYYGYVDLGLSVKWATSNFNNPMNYNYVSAQARYKELTDTITPVVRPGVKEYKLQFPTIMSYDEYLEYIEIGNLAKEYSQYKDYITKMDNAYVTAVGEYNYGVLDFRQIMYNLGTAYSSGTRPLGDKDSPQNFAGNADFDIVTNKLGEGWQTPSRAQWEELVEKCQWEDHEKYWLITGPSGKKIILPNQDRFYNTSERSDTMSNGTTYDVYRFMANKRTVQIKDDRVSWALIRPVYIK